jgi:hypothetical protein
MINGGNKKPERGSHPAIVADAAAEAQRIAAALARAEMRVLDKVQQKPIIAVTPPSSKPVIPAEKPPDSQPQRSMGFDPYNSGSFDRKHAWSKVGKR